MQAPSPPPALPVRTRRRSRQPESTPGDHQADGEADAGPDGSELRPSRDATVMRLLLVSAMKRDSTRTPSRTPSGEATFRVLN